jgi:hypothetical protein
LKKLSLLVILLMVLSGCMNGDRYDFSGSSENWEVSYVVKVSDGNKQSTTGTIKYIGEAPAPESIDYEIEAISGGTASTGVSIKDREASLGNDMCEGCAVIQKDEKLKAEINWEGQTENFLLSNSE